MIVWLVNIDKFEKIQRSIRNTLCIWYPLKMTKRQCKSKAVKLESQRPWRKSLKTLIKSLYNKANENVALAYGNKNSWKEVEEYGSL